MAQSAQIQCINRRPNRIDPHGHISHVGGKANGGWRITEEEAIAYIENGEWSFFTHEGGKTAQVIVAKHNGNKYLKTTADGLRPDNLLALPDCPVPRS